MSQIGSVMQPETRYAKSGDIHIAYQVIGDAPRDLIAGQRAGCRAGFLVETGKPIAQRGEWRVVADFAAAVEAILQIGG